MKTYVNLCSGLWVKETLHCAPEESETLACINDEHPAQCLGQEFYNQQSKNLLEKTQLKLFGMSVMSCLSYGVLDYLRVVITINLLKQADEVPCSFAKLFHPLKMILPLISHNKTATLNNLSTC